MITVLTPTYNRAHTLKRVFDSLAKQTVIDFEWLVIDDGSTDGTKVLLEELENEANFRIRYFCQRNGGKHIAINTGCNLALGAWILILDSDDALIPDAIGTATEDIKKYPNQEIMGFCYRKSYFDGTLIGVNENLESELFLHPTQAGKILKGDLAYIFRREALQAHPFPVINGEKFVPELYIWNKIGDDGKILAFPNKSIYLCEYLTDGYTANFLKNLKRNPKGFLIFYRSQIFREKILVLKIKYVVRSLQCIWYALANKLQK